MLIRPEALRMGDKVALVSLSGGLGGEKDFRHRVELGKERLEKVFGFEVVVAPNALRGCEYLSTHPEAKVQDLMWALQDRSIKGIISIIGGNDSIEILPYLNLDVIAKNPKVFCGYSDSTSVHFMFYKAGVQSFYGPCVMCQFAENVEMHDYTREAFENAIMRDDPYLIESAKKWCGEVLDWKDIRNNDIMRPMRDEKHGFEFLQGETVRGELAGGCIDVLPKVIDAGLFDAVDWNGKILFLEASDSCPEPEVVREYLVRLRDLGVFDKIRGVIFGKPKYEKYYDEYKEILREMLAGYDVSVVYNVNFGHEDPITVLPYGAEMTIDFERKILSVDNNR